MRIAVLPFSTAEGVPPAIGRQFANFVGETLRGATGAEIGAITYLADINGQPGKVAFVNLGDALIEPEQVHGIFEQGGMGLLVDGVLRKQEETYGLTLRIHHGENRDEPVVEERIFGKPDIFATLHWLIKRVADAAGLELPPDLVGEHMEFGTDHPEAFLKFLEGYDAINYVQHAQGRVAREFDPQIPIGQLMESLEIDRDFEGPYQTILELCRLCAQHRIGRFTQLADALRRLSETIPDDYRAWYALAELHMQIGEPEQAANYYEKAIEIEPNEPALYTRLGIAQMNAGMPVNAERNFRKAIQQEGPEKPSTEFLATVLAQTGRAHEVPALWKEIVDGNPQDSNAHAKYALALMQAGKKDEGINAFEHALQALEDKLLVKRYYAPILAEREELDRAMDFYEDCLDVTPTDVPLMIEYAQTLSKADREFEVPQVLRNVLAANPDPNTQAQTRAWLIELEQPKRVESVESANQKMEAGDFEGAVRELKPLRNWLADYWKIWAMLAAAYNRLEQHEEAEDASRRLINLFPGFEPAYAELMQALTAQGKHDEAYNAMRWAAMNIPNSLGVHVNLGLAAKRAGHTDEARTLAQQIREALGPNEQLEPVLAEMEA